MHKKRKPLKTIKSKRDKKIKFADFKACQHKFDKRYTYLKDNQATQQVKEQITFKPQSQENSGKR